MKFRTASTAAATSSRSSAPALGPAPSPFSIPNLPGASSSSSAAAAANKSNMLLASPPPSSTKKKNGGKRSKVRSPMIRSPLGFHKLHNSTHGSDDGVGSMSEASASLSSSGGAGTAGRKLMFSPRKRGGVGAKSKSKSSSSRGSRNPVKTRDVYSPTPEKSSAAASSADGFRGSISAAKIQGSLRKERKRRKSSFAGPTSKEASVAKSVPAIEPASSNEGGEEEEEEEMPVHQPEPELKPAAVEFAYPTSDAVAVPGPNVLQHFHQLAMSTSATAETHQAQLDSLGTRLLSLEDVLIPAAAQQEGAAIKYHQARLQRDPTTNASSIDICKSVRAYVLEMASLGATAARANRLERESAFRDRVAAREAEAGAERRRLRAEARQRQAERQAARAARRQQDRAARRVQDMRSLPRNKELYREMAALLKDQNRLQREEKKWEEAGQKLAVQQVEVERRIQTLAAEREANGGMEEEDVAGGGTVTSRDVEQSRHLAEVVERSTRNAIDDILTSAGRVESTLTEVAALVEESDAVRRELYGKYRTDHQFHGYRGNKNTKGLIVALSQS